MEAFKNSQEAVADAAEEYSKYVLSKPVKNIDGNLVNEVKIKTDFTGADIEKIANSGDKEGTWLISVVSLSTGLPMAVVRAMSAKDVKRIAVKAKNFLDAGESAKEE